MNPDKPTYQQPAVAGRPGIKSLLGKVLRYTIPVLVSAGLIIWLFHKVDIKQVAHIIRHGCDFRWIAAMMVLTMLSHIIRGIRWGIQLRGVGIPRIPATVESVSIFGAYALNLLFPYLGEAWRCVYISKREKAPLSTVVGTDLGDRASDAVVVITLFILTFILAHPVMDRFFVHYGVDRDIRHWIEDPRIWAVAAIVGGAVWTTLYFSKGHRYFQSFKNNMIKIWDGFKVLFHMDGIGMYTLLTLGIWTCYYLETYSCFYAFPFTRQLIEQPGTAYGLIPGLVVFVFGSFSIAVPSNGGLGPWNLAVMFALSLYGVAETEGAAYSITVWGCQALMLVALGIFSACYIMYDRRRTLKSAGGKPA